MLKKQDRFSRLVRNAAVAGLVGLGGLLGGTALAGVPLGVQDTFDYTDDDASTAAVGLDYSAGRLTFQLGAGAAGGLPAAVVGDYPRFASGDVPDDDFLADDLPGVELDVRAGTVYAVSLEHQAGSLDEVIDAYVSALEGYGFTATQIDSDGNVHVYSFVNGDGELRAVFTRTSDGGRAHIATL